MNYVYLPHLDRDKKKNSIYLISFKFCFYNSNSNEAYTGRAIYHLEFELSLEKKLMDTFSKVWFY